MEIKAILFDLEGTLYDYRKAQVATLKYLAKRLNQRFRIKERKFIETYRDTVAKLVTSKGSDPSIFDKNKLFAMVLNLLGVDASQGIVKELAREYYNKILKETKPYHEVVQVLKSLKASGYKLAIVSDGFVRTQMLRIDKLGLTSFFDAYAFSEEVKANKPDVRVFELALKRLGISSSEAVMIGNDLKRDIIGANMFSLKTVWIKVKGLDEKQEPTSEEERPDYTINNLSEIIEICKCLRTEEKESGYTRNLQTDLGSQKIKSREYRNR